MRTTLTISANLNCSPFEVFEQDVDEVIMLINFYLHLGKDVGNIKATKATNGNKPQKIRVNDKTASNGWF